MVCHLTVLEQSGQHNPHNNIFEHKCRSTGIMEIVLWCVYNHQMKTGGAFDDILQYFFLM